MAVNLKGRDLITTQEWSVEEIEAVLDLAKDMKKRRYNHPLGNCLKNETFFMFFYNPSVRTRQSFECAATELGGHAQFLEPKAMRLKTKTTAGETVEDAAKVMSRYAVGIGIRILEDAIEEYGQGDALLREYAYWSDVPIISMAHDKYHPCQGLADVMGAREHLGDVRGKKLLMVWGKGALVRSWCSVQESLLINTRLGMNVTLAYPEGYDLDPQVMEACRQNVAATGGKFGITHNLEEAYKGAHIVYSRNWMSPKRYQWTKEQEIEMAMKHSEWICTRELMELTDNALYTHPMPIDRGAEVTDEVASGPRSIIYDVAENRLHVQKAVMALTMADL
ncbi:MAG: ornithine carbamoyltransferase [Chloroflexi bacterium]|nr:ornithine carbamoyltransferase [Chloroflexota bacterium]MCL5074339.1 ornithine carbamoyltransferase [Chloroflexota bacterium]